MSADSKTISKDEGKTAKKNQARLVPDWHNTPIRTKYRNRIGGCFQNDIEDDELEYLILRDGPARKIVVGVASDCFKRPPRIVCDENPDWAKDANALLDKLRFHNELKEAYTSARAWGFGLVLFGLESVEDLSVPAQDVRGIKNVSSLSKTKVKKVEICEDPLDLDYYGKIKSYTVEFSINGQKVERKIHASRVLHVVDEIHNNDPGGVPALYPLFDTFQGKKNMDLSLFHAIYRYAQPFTTLELPVDADEDEFSDVSEMFYLDDRNEFVMPSGYKLVQYGAQNALNPQPYIDYMWQNLCAGSEFNKTKLVGTEAGAVTGSWVNQADYFGEIADIQTTKLNQHYVDTLRRFQAWGLLKDGDYSYEIDWPQLWELDQKEMAEMKLALARASHVEALALKEYFGMRQLGAPIEVGFDQEGWYVYPTEKGEDYKQYLFQQNTITVKARNIRQKTLKLNRYRSKQEAERLWKIWGYNTNVLELKHKAEHTKVYAAIAEYIQELVEGVLKKELPALNAKKKDEVWYEVHQAAATFKGRNPYTSNSQLPAYILANKEKATTVLARANDINSAIEEIRKKLKALPKKLSLAKAFDSMMVESHKYGWEVTMETMAQEFNAPRQDWILTDTLAGTFLQRSELLWEQKNNDILTAAKYGITEGILAGESISQIKDRIAESITKVARPDVFVNTEVHRATELGRTSLYRKLGVEKGELLTAGDDRVRPEHEDKAAAGPLPLSELEQVVAEFNCRCTIIPVYGGSIPERSEVTL